MEITLALEKPWLASKVDFNSINRSKMSKTFQQDIMRGFTLMYGLV
jgi:hypothetical protein